jgi:hypothetical protein
VSGRQRRNGSDRGFGKGKAGNRGPGWDGGREGSFAPMGRGAPPWAMQPLGRPARVDPAPACSCTSAQALARMRSA